MFKTVNEVNVTSRYTSIRGSQSSAKLVASINMNLVTKKAKAKMFIIYVLDL